jgi:hypothetical protein
VLRLASGSRSLLVRAEKPVRLPPMSRRFQFSLGRLLATVGLLCLALVLVQVAIRHMTWLAWLTIGGAQYVAFVCLACTASLLAFMVLKR